MATPVVASVGAGSNTTSVPVPSGVSAGALIVATVSGVWRTATAPTSAALTPPSGWTVKSTVAHWVQGTLGFGVFVCWKYATGADSGNYTFTLNTVGGQSSLGIEGYAERVTGGPTSGDPFVDTILTATNTSDSSVTVASSTPGGDNSLLLAAYFVNDNGTLTAPSGWAKNLDYQDTDNGAAIGLMSVAQTTAVATGSLAFTSAGGGSAGVLLSTIRPPVTDNAGVLSAMLTTLAASVAGTQTDEGVTSSSSPRVTGSVSGTQSNAASLNAHTPVLTAAIGESVVNAGMLVAVTPALTATVAGSQTDAGTLSVHTTAPTGSVTGTSTDVGVLTAHVPVLSTAITGTQVNAGALSASTPVVTAMLAESNVNRGGLAAVTPVLGASVTGAQLNAGSVAGSTPLITASIADVVVNAFTSPRLATTTNGSTSRVIRTNPSTGAPLDGGAYLVGTVNAVGLFPRLTLTGVTGWNPGDVKTLSVYMMATAGTVLQLGGQFGGQTGTDYFATTFIATGSWQRVWMQITAPSVSTGSFTLWAGVADNTPIGVAFGISNGMLTAGPYLYPYEDGDSAGWSWSGTSGASVSQGPATPSNPAYMLPVLPVVTVSVAGSSINSAAVVATVPGMLGSVTGTQTNTGALLVRTPTVNATVSGQMIIAAVLAATVPLLLMYVTGIVPRNITVTAQLASRRWVGQIQPRNKTGSTQRRWAGNNG